MEVSIMMNNSVLMENSIDLNVTKTRADSIDEYVSKQIRQRRILLGKSQSDVASALKLSIQQIQKYESGENRLSSSKLFQIAQLLKTTVDFFFQNVDTAADSKLSEEAVSFEFDKNYLHEKDIITLINSFKSIESPTVRKNILDLAKSLAKS